MRRGSRPARALALGWLLLAACAGGRAGQPGDGTLPAWARAPSTAATHPEPEVVRGVHRVEKGETLFRIAKGYGLTAEELAAANGLDVSATLVVGSDLLIPGAVEPAAGTPSQTAPAQKEAVQPPVAKVWETAVEPRAGQPLPPDLLKAFDTTAKAPADVPLPADLARAFDHPTAPVARPTSAPVAAPPLAEKSAAISASIGPMPGAEAPKASLTAGRASVAPRGSIASAPAGVLQWPLRGVLYARFGKKGREPHDGIDLAAPAGTPVQDSRGGDGALRWPTVRLWPHRRRRPREGPGYRVRPQPRLACADWPNRPTGPSHRHRRRIREDERPPPALRSEGGGRAGGPAALPRAGPGSAVRA